MAYLVINLNDSTYMQDRLLEIIYESISETVPEHRIGIAFSGGVDSSLISKACHDMGYDVVLLTIGFPDSHDIMFSKKINQSLGLSHHILEIDHAAFPDISRKINLAIGTQNLSWNENCIAFYYVSRLANKLEIDTVVTANGIDELFCGYNAYRDIFQKGIHEILETMDAKLENEIKMMEAVNRVSSEFNVRIVQPLLSDRFVKYARIIPMREKIHGPDDLLRKHIIRRLACHTGVPKLSCTKRKKALQYGSKIHKTLLKTR